MTLVLLNRAAAGGTALRKWRAVEPDLHPYLGDRELAVTEDPRLARTWIEDSLYRGERRFVAAGGDGTVNLLVDTIAGRAPPDVLHDVCVGAVGLGSSNDFHKPIRKAHQVRGVPLRLDFGSPATHDLCLVYADEYERRHWIINASVGLTAEANRFFNRPERALRTLKKLSSGAAVAYAAAHTLAAKGDRLMTVQVECARPFLAVVTNLGVVKNPNVSGPLSYRSPYEPDSGFFHVHLCEGMSRARVMSTLWQSARRGFIGLPFTRSWRARQLCVEAAEQFPVEFDGETVLARRVSFSVLKGAIRICG